jgi:hypothetical protein
VGCARTLDARLTVPLKFNMGIESTVKKAMRIIKVNNTSNPQTGRLWCRRVQEIAADLEQLGDTAK